MTTQSKLFDQSNSSLQIKTLFQVECIGKPKWLNRTSGDFKSGIQMEARIVSMRPTVIPASASQSYTSNSKLQMSSLFSQLASLPDQERGKPNIKVGAINTFFEQIADKIGEFFKKIFDSLVKYFDGMIKASNRSKSGHVSKREESRTKFNWNKCTPQNYTFTPVQARSFEASRTKRNTKEQKSTSFTNVDYLPVEADLTGKYQRPFRFVQLEDGSVQSISLASDDLDPTVINFKQFLAQSFSTQLDERKRKVLESSTLGRHMSHYQMEYDEPSLARANPQGYMKNLQTETSREKNGHKNKRATHTRHLVSVIRSIHSDDILESSDDVTASTRHEEEEEHGLRKFGKNKEFNLKSGPAALKLANIDFTAEQVQLIENNLLIASGKYQRIVVVEWVD